jgi:uncharacterized coiled-coil protein SlyX
VNVAGFARIQAIEGQLRNLNSCESSYKASAQLQSLRGGLVLGEIERDMTAESTNERMVSQETAVAHLQHTVDQMHEVILALQDDIAALRRDLQRAHVRIDEMSEADEGGDVLDERPPHY